MTEFISFFVVLFAAVFFSALFNRLHLPWVVALLLGGMVIGPFGFNVLQSSPTLELLGEIGLVFLMFMAGLETRIESVRHRLKEVGILGVANSVIPFGVGAMIGTVMGLNPLGAILLGIIFVSTSVAIVVPSFEANGIFSTRLGNTTIAATIIEDIVSLLALSVLLQAVSPTSNIPLIIFYPLLLLVLVGLRFAIPWLRMLFSYTGRRADLFQQELRLVFAMLIGIVIIFELLGLHTIIAGFFAGILLSDSVRSRLLKEKLRAISYGLFIPIFFVLIGTKTNLQVFFEVKGAVLLAVAIIGGSIASKLVSGWLAARVIGFTNTESWLVGVATTPSLTTTLAVAFTGFEMGLLSQSVVTVLVLLSVVTTFVGPLAINYLAKKVKAEETDKKRPAIA